MKNAFTVEIDAPPERVFYWLDGGERTIRWIPNLVENVDLEVKPGKVGSIFRHVYLERGRRMEMTGEVTAYEANRRLACKLASQVFDLSVDYSLESRDGQTRLTQSSEIRFKTLPMRIIGALLKPFMHTYTQRQIQQTFDTLKALAETGDDPPPNR